MERTPRAVMISARLGSVAGAAAIGVTTAEAFLDGGWVWGIIGLLWIPILGTGALLFVRHGVRSLYLGGVMVSLVLAFQNVVAVAGSFSGRASEPGFALGIIITVTSSASVVVLAVALVLVFHPQSGEWKRLRRVRVSSTLRGWASAFGILAVSCAAIFGLVQFAQSDLGSCGVVLACAHLSLDETERESGLTFPAGSVVVASFLHKTFLGSNGYSGLDASVTVFGSGRPDFSRQSFVSCGAPPATDQLSPDHSIWTAAR